MELLEEPHDLRHDDWNEVMVELASHLHQLVERQAFFSSENEVVVIFIFKMLNKIVNVGAI